MGEGGDVVPQRVAPHLVHFGIDAHHDPAAIRGQRNATTLTKLPKQPLVDESFEFPGIKAPDNLLGLTTVIFCNGYIEGSYACLEFREPRRFKGVGLGPADLVCGDLWQLPDVFVVFQHGAYAPHAGWISFQKAKLYEEKPLP